MSVEWQEFIEMAEDNGLITRMGEWMIRAALKEAARLPDHVKVAVNISPLQIHSSTLVATIVNGLAANNIKPNRLELEITESVLMTDTEFTLKRLHQIKDLGVRISLDDFGTGYSSLSYLRAFPFDKIKIDKSFVKDIESRPHGGSDRTNPAPRLCPPYPAPDGDRQFCADRGPGPGDGE